ncbi:MAG: hypothetical protein NXI10_09975 [bacterium]|nr:hypothetical protein [bacterium]
MKRLVVLGVALAMATSIHAHPTESVDHDPIEITDDWTALISLDGIEVEYKVQECNNQNVRNQVLVLFRFKNTSETEIKTFNWAVKEFRNDVCTNCNRLETQEFKRSLTLSPGEIVEGDGTSKMDKRVYVFSHFIELVPGMSNQTLTDFEFMNMEVINQGTQK